MNAPKQSPGGILLPPTSEVVDIHPVAFRFGGLEVEIPADPKVILQVTPQTLQDSGLLLGVLSNLINHLNALTRKVNRLRKRAGLAEWAGGVRTPKEGPPSALDRLEPLEHRVAALESQAPADPEPREPPQEAPPS